MATSLENRKKLVWPSIFAVSGIISGIVFDFGKIGYYFLPGLTFGIFLSFFVTDKFKEIAKFSIISMLIYTVAVGIVDIVNAPYEIHYYSGAISGIFGSFTLCLLVKIIGKIKLTVMNFMFAIISGGVMGFIFMFLGSDSSSSLPNILIAFVLWQTAVGSSIVYKQ